MYRDSLKRKDVRFKLEHNKVIGSDSSSSGYQVTKSYAILDEETITISNSFGSYSTGELSNVVKFTLGDTYIVTFNGTKYECVAYDEDDTVYLGATWDNDLNQLDWSVYPFVLNNENGDFGLYTLLTVQTDGEYSVKIEREEETVETTPEFEAAINSVTGGITPVNLLELPCFKPLSEWYPFNTNPQISDILADGFSLVTYGDATMGGFYIAQTVDENTVPYQLPNDILEKYYGLWSNCTPVLTAHIDYVFSWEVEYITGRFGFGGNQVNSVEWLLPYVFVDYVVLGGSWDNEES